MTPDHLSITPPVAVAACRETTGEILQILNASGDMPDTIRRVIAVLKMRLGFDAVGIRLQRGEDFPYFAQEGFPENFLATENSLIAHAADGEICRNKDGSACLECTCGLVISGRTDPFNPLFTRGGSCWTNDSLPLLNLPASEDPRINPRNRCFHKGYVSLALGDLDGAASTRAWHPGDSGQWLQRGPSDGRRPSRAAPGVSAQTLRDEGAHQRDQPGVGSAETLKSGFGGRSPSQTLGWMIAVIADDNRVRFRVRQVSVLSNLYWSFVHDAAKPDLIVPEPL